MPDTVTLTHPNLPGRSITVREDAVSHYQQSGWQQQPVKSVRAPLDLSIPVPESTPDVPGDAPKE